MRLSATLGVAALAVALLSLLSGPAGIPVTDLAAALGRDGDPLVRAILIELRLPRAVLALAIGAALGLSGALLQSYLRNPLADSSVLGTANCAALGAVIAFYFGLYQAAPLSLPLLAIAGAVAGLVPVMLLSRRSENPVVLILTGVAIGTLAAAGISLMLNLAANPFAAMEIMTWLMGSLEDRSMVHVAIALPFIVAGMAIMGWDAGRTDALILSEDSARSLGLDIGRLRWRIALGVGLAVGGSVAVSGAIGFVGLIVPHLIRPFTDRSPSALLLPSAAAGALLLASADWLVRVLPTPGELKLGVVTAMIGVPVFLHHLMKARRLW